MGKPILCATDLGASGATALAWAAAWSRMTGAELILLHVDGTSHQAVMVPESIRVAAEALAARLDQRRKDHESALQANVANLDIQCSLRLADGHPWEATLEVAEELDAGLIVVGPHAHGLGSTARRIVTHATRPVLVARGVAPRTLDETRWVVGVPSSEAVPPLLRHVDALAHPHRGTMALTRAVAEWPAIATATGTPLAMPPVEEFRSAAEDHLRELAEKLQSTCTVHAECGRPDEVLESVANDGDVIAVAAHDRGIIERFFLGSVTERLLRHTRHSVYVEPAGK